MSAYISLLKLPGVTRIVTAQLLARFPFGMLSLGLLLHIEHIHHSYTAAGLVLAFLSTGQAIAGPVMSRLMGYFGMRLILSSTLLFCVGSISILGIFAMPLPLTLGIAFLAGLSAPPIQASVRTIYPKIVSSQHLSPLFALDASAQELIWIAGPVVITLVATQISTIAGLLLTSSVFLSGGLWYISCKEVGQVRIPKSTTPFGAVLLKPPVFLTTIVTGLLLGTAAGVEVGIVALYGEGSALAGGVLALWALVSLIGGLTLGRLPIGPWANTQRMFIIFVGTLTSVLLFDYWWGVLLGLLISGFGVAPVFVACFSIVSQGVKFSDTPEAYGWLNSGQLVGLAIGSAFAGFAIDQAGPQGAFWVCTAFAFAGVVFPILTYKINPDLRNKDLAPKTDTEPISINP